MNEFYILEDDVEEIIEGFKMYYKEELEKSNKKDDETN